MITQELSLYEEPVYGGTQTAITQEEFVKALDDAQKYIRVGDKFKYKQTKDAYTVVGFVSCIADANKYSGKLCVIRARHGETQAETRFSVDEFFGAHMEQVFDEEQKPC